MRLIVSELCKKEMKKRNSEFDLPVLLHNCFLETAIPEDIQMQKT